METADIIGKGKTFEPPFKCMPSGSAEKTHVLDRNMKCVLEIRGARHIQGTHRGMTAQEVQKIQQMIGDEVCCLLNSKFRELW